MKKTLIIALFLISITNAQNYTTNLEQNFEVGDIFIINNPSEGDFKYIDFPKANFIIKKGGIADFKTVDALEVRIKSMKNFDNKNEVVLERVDDQQFFNRFPTVKANLDGAIAAGELLVK